MLMMSNQPYLLHRSQKQNLLKTQCLPTELSGNTFIVYLNYVIEMFLKLLED